VPAEWLGRWNLDPILLLTLALAIILFLRQPHVGARERRLITAAASLALLLFVSPFCALTSAFFSARAVHHLLLTAVLPPLVVTAFPRCLHIPGGAIPWTAVHALIFWSWHVPQAYSWALSSNAAYWLMQASLLLSAAGLWSAISRTSVTNAIAALLGTMVQMGLLGALLTFASTALYAPHLIAPIAWGLSSLEDQQLAGLIMWAPGAGIYLAAAIALLARWFAREQAATLAK